MFETKGGNLWFSTCAIDAHLCYSIFPFWTILYNLVSAHGCLSMVGMPKHSLWLWPSWDPFFMSKALDPKSLWKNCYQPGSPRCTGWNGSWLQDVPFRYAPLSFSLSCLLALLLLLEFTYWALNSFLNHYFGSHSPQHFVVVADGPAPVASQEHPPWLQELTLKSQEMRPADFAPWLVTKEKSVWLGSGCECGLYESLQTKN